MPKLITIAFALVATASLAVAQRQVKFNPFQHLDDYTKRSFSDYSDLFERAPFEPEAGAYDGGGHSHGHHEH